MGFSGWAIKKALNSRSDVRRLGVVESVDVDTDRREITLDFTLAGDTCPTTFTASYSIEPETFLVTGLRAEKLWMQAAIDFWFRGGRRLELPLRHPLVGNLLQLLF